MPVKRYEIYCAALSPTDGGEIQKTRPVVVVSKTAMNRYLNAVVVCPLTTSFHPPWRSRIQVKCAEKDAEIAVDQIRTIRKVRLSRTIDTIASEDAPKPRMLITEMYGE
jgi:mRNA interferase MazF